MFEAESRKKGRRLKLFKKSGGKNEQFYHVLSPYIRLNAEFFFVKGTFTLVFDFMHRLEVDCSNF